MPDPADVQAAYAELFTELLLQHLHSAPPPPQPAPPATAEEALERMARAMDVMYATRRR